jgi:hypothetical protein
MRGDYLPGCRAGERTRYVQPNARSSGWKDRYLEQNDFDQLDDAYDKTLGQLVRMLAEPGKWSIH